VLRTGLVDLIELAPIGIFFGPSASRQVEQRVSTVCCRDGASVARAPEVAQVGGQEGDLGRVRERRNGGGRRGRRDRGVVK